MTTGAFRAAVHIAALLLLALTAVAGLPTAALADGVPATTRLDAETPATAGGSGAGTTSARPAAQTEHVVIFDRDKYFEVHLDVAGCTPYQLGYEYGRGVMKAMPSFARWAWAYLTAAHFFLVDYDTCVERAMVLRQNIPLEVRQQIEGMAAGIKAGGGGFWIDEKACYVMTLFPDVGRDTQCSALCAWGTRTPDGQPVVGRILDWTTSILPRLNAVTVFHNGKKSFCSIGFLGTWSVISGFNDRGVFGAILDAPTGRPYPKGKDLMTRRSYPTDLRAALENASSVSAAARYLQPPRDYCFSHQILLGDKSRAAILENDLTGTGPYSRQLRTDTTPLTAGVQWGYKDAVCAVNSFVADGNECDHFKDKWNTHRWNDYRSLMNTVGRDTISWDTLKDMLGYGGPDEKYMPYNFQSVQLMVYKPTTGQLEVAFCGRSEDLPRHPVWTPVKVSFSDRVFGTSWAKSWQPRGWKVTETLVDTTGGGAPCAAVQLEKGAGDTADAAVGIVNYNAYGRLRWRRVLDLPGARLLRLTDMAVARDGSVVVVGMREVGRQVDWLVARYTPSGRRAWIRYLSGRGVGRDIATAVACDRTGNVIVGGLLARAASAATRDGDAPKRDSAAATRDAASQDDWCLRKYSAGGRVLWTRTPGTTGKDMITALTPGGSGTVFVTGTWGAGERGIATARYSAAGRRLWLKTWSHSDTRSPLPTAVAAGRSVVAVCGLDAGETMAGGLVFALRAHDGRRVWTHVRPGTSEEASEYSDVAVARGDAVVAVGSLLDGADVRSYLLSWFAADGALQHAETGGYAGGVNRAGAVGIDGGGNAFVAGFAKPGAAQAQTVFVQSWTPAAALRWEHARAVATGPASDAVGCDVALSRSSVYVAADAGDALLLMKRSRAGR